MPSHPIKKIVSVRKMRTAAKDVIKMSNEKPCCCSGGKCCSGKPITPYDKKDEWVKGEAHTPQGGMPVVSMEISLKDMWGTWKVRWA